MYILSIRNLEFLWLINKKDNINYYFVVRLAHKATPNGLIPKIRSFKVRMVNVNSNQILARWARTGLACNPNRVRPKPDRMTRLRSLAQTNK